MPFDRYLYNDTSGEWQLDAFLASLPGGMPPRGVGAMSGARPRPRVLNRRVPPPGVSPKARARLAS